MSWFDAEDKKKEEWDINKDVSQTYVDFLESQSTNPQFSFIGMTIGVGGSGKTGNAFMIIQIVLEGDTYVCKWDDEDTHEHHERPRNVAMFRVPDTLLIEIKKAMMETGYEKFCDRFRIVHHLWEVMNNDIVLIDEGVLHANAKEALKKEFVDFEKGLSYSRHKRIICLLNATDDGFMLAWRKMAHITFYKQVGKGFIDYCKDDKFVQKVGYKLTKLKVNEAIVFSSYKYFNEIGRVTLDLMDICPWFTDKISQSLAGKSFSSLFEERKDLIDRVYEYAKTIADKFRKRLDERGIQKIITGWMIKQDFKTYFELKKYMSEIFSVAYYEYDLVKQEEKAAGEELEDTGRIGQQVNEMVMRDENFTFDRMTYLEENWVKNDQLSKNSQRDFFIYQLQQGGVPYTPISKQVKEKFGKDIGEEMISKIVKKVNSVMSKINLIMGKAYEIYLEKKLKKALEGTGASVVRDGHRGKPDIVVYWPDGKVTVYSVKCLAIEDDTIYVKASESQAEVDFCNELSENTQYVTVELILHLYYLPTKEIHERHLDFKNMQEHERFDVMGKKKREKDKEEISLQSDEAPIENVD